MDAPDEDDGILLPPPAERAALRKELGSLVARCGPHALLLAPLLESNERFFPDPWKGGAQSLRRLLRRLMRYADLEDLEVEVELDTDDGPPPNSGGVWFTGRSGRTCRFGAFASALRDPVALVAAAARAVAHCFRKHHDLPTASGAAGERLIDITTVYLGFGILTTDASLRFSAKGAGGFSVQRSKSQLGVLPPQAMGYLLAAVLVARGTPKKERRRITNLLQPNQAEFVRRSVEVLGDLQPPLREQWELPDPRSLGGVSLRTLAAPMDDDHPDADATEERHDVDRGPVGTNVGKPVFRVERSMALKLASALGFMVMVVGGMVSRSPGVDIPMTWVTGGAISLAITGLIIGALIRDSRCSDPKCNAKLVASAKTCPRCGGNVMGVIKDPKHRLEAEEALRNAEAGEPEG